MCSPCKRVYSRLCNAFTLCICHTRMPFSCIHLRTYGFRVPVCHLPVRSRLSRVNGDPATYAIRYVIRRSHSPTVSASVLQSGSDPVAYEHKARTTFDAMVGTRLWFGRGSKLIQQQKKCFDVEFFVSTSKREISMLSFWFQHRNVKFRC